MGAYYSGHAYVFSRATGAVLGTLASPDPEFSGHFGGSVSGLPEADGDGKGDLLIGAAGERAVFYRAGRFTLVR